MAKQKDPIVKALEVQLDKAITDVSKGAPPVGAFRLSSSLSSLPVESDLSVTRRYAHGDEATVDARELRRSQIDSFDEPDRLHAQRLKQAGELLDRARQDVNQDPTACEGFSLANLKDDSGKHLSLSQAERFRITNDTGIFGNPFNDAPDEKAEKFDLNNFIPAVYELGHDAATLDKCGQKAPETAGIDVITPDISGNITNSFNTNSTLNFTVIDKSNHSTDIEATAIAATAIVENPKPAPAPDRRKHKNTHHHSDHCNHNTSRSGGSAKAEKPQTITVNIQANEGSRIDVSSLAAGDQPIATGNVDAKLLEDARKTEVTIQPVLPPCTNGEEKCRQ